MIRFVLSSVLLVIGVAVVSADAGEPFDSARFAPADVTTFVHVEDAGALRETLQRRPIMRWVRSLTSGQAAESWKRLAADAEMESDELFDLCFGRATTIMRRGAGDERDEWVAVTRVSPARLDRVLARLRPVARTPMSGMAIADLPEHDLVLARDGERLIVGSRGRPRLFRQVVQGAAVPRSQTLADHPGIVRGRTLGAGRAAVLVRHAAPLGGWSVLVADIAGDRVTVKHDAQFENPPFQRDVTEMKWGAAALDAFDDRTLLTIIEPMDVGGGAVNAWLETVLVPLNDELRNNLGQHRILAVGELEGRQERAVDLLLPAAALCVQLADAETAERALDKNILALASRLDDFAPGAPRLDVPRRRTLVPGDARHIALDPVVKQFSGGLPIIESISLNWQVVETPGGPYAVLATHPRQLRDAVEALGSTNAEPGEVGEWCQCGTASGQRLAVHLRSWADQPGMLAEPGREDEFRATLTMLSELAAGVQRCRWKLARPIRTEMMLEVELTLSPPESAE